MRTNLVVIPVRKEPREANQLRYAVRAWTAHLPRVEVVLIGGCPSWWAGDHVRTEQGSDLMDQWVRNFPAALRASVTLARELDARSYWWAADDIYPLAPVPEDPPTWCRPLDLDIYLSEWDRQRVTGSYTRAFIEGVRGQRDILRDLGVTTQHNADMHVPHLVRPERVAELLDLFAAKFPSHPAGHWRAVYGGLWPGRIERIEDPKVALGRRADWNQLWLSTSAAVWRRGVAREMAVRFPAPSRYEGDR